jgi:RimJ/RimL family protein N-acetyltransferase
MESLSTQRLILRRWQPSDIEEFALICADPVVMEFHPKTLTLEQSKSMVERIEAGFDRERFGLWALELQNSHKFIGYTGLCRPSFQAHFTPCVEIGWKIAREYWGNGFATEAARKAVEDGFERIQLNEIVSMTAAINKRSIRVMEKLKMVRNEKDDFLHPSIENGHPLKPHVLFRLSKAQWDTQLKSPTER